MKVEDNARIQRHDRSDGLTILLAENHALPRVSFRVSLRSGSSADPEPLAGLSRVHSELLLRGTKKLNRKQFAERIEGFGSSLGGDASADSESWSGESLTRYFADTFGLLGEALLEPRWDEKELAKLVRELEAERVMRLDDDATLARLYYRRLVFPGHPYGRDSLGNPTSLAALTTENLAEEHRKRLVSGNVIVGAAGDVTMPELQKLIDTHLALPRGGSLAAAPTVPKEPQGYQIYLVDKPDRSQSQVVFGRPALPAAAQDFLALQTAVTAFGGTFTAPLMHEVREVRGWSYGAYASLGESRGKGSFAMSAAPGEADAAPCLALMIDLYKRFVAGEYEEDLFLFGRQFLLNQHPFSLATPEAQLNEYLHAELLELPAASVADYPERLKQLGIAAVRRMPERYLLPNDLVIVVVGTAERLAKAIRDLPFAQAVKVIPYDSGLEQLG